MTEVESPGERYWRWIEPAWVPLNRSWDLGPVGFLRQFNAVRPEVGHLYAAHWCQSEVRNGGLHQFFSNSTGILAPEAREGFEAIGLVEWAAILSEAMQSLGNPHPRCPIARQAVLKDLVGPIHERKREDWDPFYHLDERFYAWLHAEPDRWERMADRYAEMIKP